jgi:methylthioribose-1-phosphate isomerase
MAKKIPETLFWKDDILLLLNQLELPYKVVYKECKNYKRCYKSDKSMIVRGAPAIGVASAYAMLLAGIKSSGLSPSAKLVFMKKAADELINSRPTAVNLKWAVEKMMKVG